MGVNPVAMIFAKPASFLKHAGDITIGNMENTFHATVTWTSRNVARTISPILQGRVVNQK